MRSLIAIILVSLITNSAYSQKEDKKENKDNKETQNTKVTPGASGVKRSIGYRFSSATGDADPGDGTFRYDNNVSPEVKYIFVDDIDIKGEDQTKWYRTWEDSTGASGRGQILIVKLNSEVVNIFDFTDVFTDGDGYWKFPVEYVSGTMPANDSVYYYIFNRIAHGRDKVEEVIEVVEKVEEKVEVIEKVTEVIVDVPVEVPAAEPVIEVKVEEVPVVVVPAEVPEPEPVVVEVKVEEAPVVTVPAVIPEPEPVVAEVKVEEEPVVAVPVVIPEPEPVVAEVKVEEAPVVTVPEVVPEPQPVVVEVKVEEVPVIAEPLVVPEPEPVIVVAAEVHPVEPVTERVEEVKVVEAIEEAVEVVEKVAEVVIEPAKVTEPEKVIADVKVEEAPVAAVTVVVPEPEPVVIETKVEEAPVVAVVAEVPVAEAPKITDRKTKVSDKPQVTPETKVTDVDTIKVLPNKIDEGVQTTLPEPKKETTVAQGPPRVTETKPAEPVKAPSVPQNVPPAPEPKPAQQTTTATGPPRVTENKPASQPQGTTVPQGTQKPHATQPATETRPATVYQPASAAEAPVTNSFAGSSGRVRGKCYRGIIELGYGLKVSEYGMNNFRFNFINGFNIRSTSIGLGIGVRKYYDKPAKHPDWHLVSSDVQIPVFLDVRTHFSTKKVTPYLGIGIGNAAGFDSDTTNNKSEGLYFHATGGIWFNLSDRFAVFGGVAYEMQRLRYANFSDEIIFNKYTNSLSLNIGIAF